MHRILKAVLKKENIEEIKILIKFKEFLKNDINLIDNNLLKQLNSLSHTRNSLAHVGQPDYNRINKVVKNIVDNKSPKTILLFILDI